VNKSVNKTELLHLSHAVFDQVSQLAFFSTIEVSQLIQATQTLNQMASRSGDQDFLGDEVLFLTKDQVLN
jgi:hypothetical protein